jgi:hypothetical protein
MANKQITVNLSSSTTATGPYSVYKTSISEDNLLESNISLASLITGKIYRVDTSIGQVVIINENAECCCSAKTIIINAT